MNKHIINFLYEILFLLITFVLYIIILTIAYLSSLISLPIIYLIIIIKNIIEEVQLCSSYYEEKRKTKS